MRSCWLALPLIAAAVPAAAQDCAGLKGKAGEVVVTAATAVVPAPTNPWRIAQQGGYAPLPVAVPFCRLEGTIEGNIGFEVWLPQAWNGRLLGAGVGGDAGVFNYGDMSRRLAEGFATVTTDSGHKVSSKRWMADAKARVDYEHRATHLSAVAAKTLAARFYGRVVGRSYFLGCSGGGRQGLKEMEEYPADYDGIVSGAPGPYMPLISVRMMWFSLLQKRDPAGALSDADWTLYERATTAACDATDGVRDGVIENPLACGYQPAALLCKPDQVSDCLSAPKLKMLQAIVKPMQNEQGRAMDRGLLPGVRTRPGPPSPLLRAMWVDAVYNDPDWNEDTFGRTVDLAKANAAMPQLRADSTRIAPFLARGGKAIIYQGWADPSVIAGPTVDFYRRLQAANGGERLADNVRLMMVPGMYHCRGGPGVDQFGGSGQESAPGDASRDILWAVIDWVERGRTPERLVGMKLVHGKPAFSRALCPFPQAARYDGKGPEAEAGSYQCRTDPVLAAYK